MPRYFVKMAPSSDKTFKEGQIIKDTSTGNIEISVLSDKKGFFENVFEPQHLYILTDDKPKKGDVCLFPNGLVGTLDHPTDGYTIAHSSKILASDDEELIEEGIPLIDKKFVKNFVENLNEFLENEGSKFEIAHTNIKE